MPDSIIRIDWRAESIRHPQHLEKLSQCCEVGKI